MATDQPKLSYAERSLATILFTCAQVLFHAPFKKAGPAARVFCIAPNGIVVFLVSSHKGIRTRNGNATSQVVFCGSVGSHNFLCLRPSVVAIVSFKNVSLAGIVLVGSTNSIVVFERRTYERIAAG